MKMAGHVPAIFMRQPNAAGKTGPRCDQDPARRPPQRRPSTVSSSSASAQVM